MEKESVFFDITGLDLNYVFGDYDSNIKIIENALNVSFVTRDGALKIFGDKKNTKAALDIIKELIMLSKNGGDIDEQSVRYALSVKEKMSDSPLVSLDQDIICHTIQGKPVKPKTMGQKNYVDSIRKNMITFGIGPAGTGKTYLAMAMAIVSLQREDVNRIILTRPAIEAGEKLGFLPGDLQSKVDPYLRPLYDALYIIMGAETLKRNMEKGVIEVAPLAYMRGRTLDNSFIILDEAQNTTPSQMKMFLTRIGFSSKAVITGDRTQKDLPKDALSGLDNAVNVLKSVPEISICNLTGEDVVRHPLVQKIVKAYDDFDKKKNEKRNKR